MDYYGIEICCPHCRGELFFSAGGDTELECYACQRKYPIVCGIPDLRVFPDPYIGFDEDREKGLKVAVQLDTLTFAELVAYYYSNTSVVPAHHAEQYTRGLLSAAPRSAAALQSWETTAFKGEARNGGTFLDLGCGTAPLLVAASKNYEKVVGVDIAFRWLVVARKRLDEAGVKAPLICACAEALPFPDEQFDVIASESTLEHVKDQEKTLLECFRGLKLGGHFFLSTPNRYSLGPDPQVGILAGGYLPEKIIAGIVRGQGGIPPKRQLLSFRDLRKLLGGTEFSTRSIFLPELPFASIKHLPGWIQYAVFVYHILKRVPITKQILQTIGPLIFSVVYKPIR